MYETLVNSYHTVINYFESLYEAIDQFKDELIQILKNKDDIDSLDDINKDKLTENINTMNKYLSNTLTVHNTLVLYDMLINIITKLDEDIKIINSIDIYEVRTMISDTFKKNIHKNKIKILDLYEKSISHILKLKQDIIKDSAELVGANDVYKYSAEHNNTIDILVYVLKFKEVNVDVKNTIIRNIKSVILKSDNASITLTDTKAKRAKHMSFKNENLFLKMNRFRYVSHDTSLKKLLNNTLSLKSNTTITDTFNKTNLENIYKLVLQYNKTFKRDVMIIILCSNKDNITYNLKDLLDPKLKIPNTAGINDQYIKKFNTVTDKKEEVTDYYISGLNITKIHVVNYIQLSKLTIDEYNTEVVLINYSNNRYELYKNIDGSDIKVKDVINLLTNKPDYNIECYNDIVEESIIQNSTKINIADEYKRVLSLDTNVYADVDITNLKNEILTKVKAMKLKFNLENKQIVIENTLNIVLKSVSKYIRTKNNIELTGELYITCFSSINSLLSKFKKELVDNYSEDLIEKLTVMLDNMKKNIAKIDTLMIEKYYYTNIR